MISLHKKMKINNKMRCIFIIASVLFYLLPIHKTFAMATCQMFDPPTSQFGLALENVLPASTLERPIAMVQPPNDASRWFVVDQNGQVIIFNNSATFVKSGVLVDLRDRVMRELNGRAWNELGLLSIAVHPNFANNGHVYLYYTAQGPSADFPVAVRLSRFTSFDKGLTLDPNSEEIIFEIPRDTVFHFGGQMQFHPIDGYFYMSIGDGGRKPKAQDFNDLNGSFIRLDLYSGTFPYSIPADNPFVNGPGRGEIYAKGLRNPWRWSFDSLTNKIFLGDVGKSSWEEINIIEAGKNYGWPIKEGSQCFEAATCDSTGLIDPIVEYPHDATGGFAVLGGYVYRGTKMPNFYGKYIYADVTGRVWSIDANNTANAQPQVVLETAPYYYAFAEGIDKELYLLGDNSIEKLKESVVTTSNNKVPDLLSQTGCFDTTSPLVPASTLIPYEINMPLWSDGAEKDRWMRLPDNGKISVTSEHDWTYPIGSVLVKNFELAGKIIETRLFIRHLDGSWAGYSYEWDDNQTDARLLSSEAKEKQIGNQTWLYPSRVQCMQCHTEQAGFVLGPETAQLNLEFPSHSLTNSSNQLSQLAKLNIFENENFSRPTRLPKLAALDDSSQTKHWRARSYLYSNCAMCHQPGGPGRGPEDFRYAVTDAQIFAINVDPSISDLGIVDGKLIYPGEPDKSIMALRMHSLDSETRMPPLATSKVDVAGTQLVDQWISSIQSPAPSFDQSCGEPTISSSSADGIYLWQICNNPGRWHFRAFAADETKHYQGKIVTKSPIIQINRRSVDPSDTLSVNPAGKLVYFDFKTRSSYTDGFSLSVDANTQSCLSFDFPEHTQIRLGANAVEINTNTLDLQTLSSCGEITTLGKPIIDMAVDKGIYIWQRDSTTWVVNGLAKEANSVSNIIGSITSNMAYTSVTPLKSIEPNDTAESIYPGLIDFKLNVIEPNSDDFEFSVPEDADLCFDLENTNYPVYLGPLKKQITYPYNLTTLGPCKQINIDGKPDIDPAQEAGIYIWRDQDVWYVNSATTKPYFFVQGSIQAYNELIDWQPLTLELNNSTDIFKSNNKNRLDFRMVTSLDDQDEFSFVINDALETCIDIEHPVTAPLYLGPDKKLILPPYNLADLSPCRHGDP